MIPLIFFSSLSLMILQYLQCKDTLLISVIDVVKSDYPLRGKIIIEFNSQIKRILIYSSRPCFLCHSTTLFLQSISQNGMNGTVSP